MYLILHIPHSSTKIPKDLRSQFIISDAELVDKIHHMTDAYTDDLFPAEYERLVFPVSRIVCDPERFADDSMESMAAKGMGVNYTRGYKESLIRRCPNP